MTENITPSFKNVMYSTPIGRAVIIGGIIAAMVLGYHAIDSKIQSKVRFEQSIGNQTPDVYIQQGNQRFYSQVDGKSIEELVKEKK